MRLIIVAVFLLVSGCTALQNEQFVPKQLQGEWNWYATTGGWGTQTDADSVEYSMTLKIYAQNQAEWFRNDTLIQSYDIVEGQQEWTKGELVLFRHGDADDGGCGFILDYYPRVNELHLRTALCTDSPTYYFTKGN